MYLIEEDDIIAWKTYHELHFIQCACRFTENCSICDNGGGGSKRQEMKVLIKKLKKNNPNIDKNIFRSMHNVNLDTLIGYHTANEQHHFLDTYKEK